jgi:hypothetical protein
VERLVSLNVMGRPITPDEIALAVLDAPQGGQADGPQQVVP